MRSLIKSKNRFITRPENDYSNRETISSLFLDGNQYSGRKNELFNVIDGSAEMINKDKSDIRGIINVAEFLSDYYHEKLEELFSNEIACYNSADLGQ